ncbi:MAG TPA: Ig-like domain-containing protein [Longimicrobium sp.]|nr:Ig-like domain-containing protein [Longimicrobium sp.]
MKRLLPAFLLAALAAAACDSPSGGGGGSPDIARVFVTPSESTLNAGETVQLSAQARDGDNGVVSGAQFQWASLEQDVATVTQTGLVTGIKTGSARIVATADGKADTATVNVIGSAAECDAPGAGISLGVGQSVQRTGAAATVLCLDGGAAGAEFTVTPFFGSRVNSATVALRADPAGVTAPTGPPSPSLAPSSSLLLPPAGAGAQGDGGFHTRLNERAREPLSRLIPGARDAYRRRTAGARLSMQQQAPTLGTVLPLNVSQSFCDEPDTRHGRVVAVSDRAVIVADTMNPAGGLSDADYQHVAATFDSLIYPVNVAAFGEPQDVDQNGRVVIFYTRAVNELTPRNANYIVGGFFYGRDLFPRTAQAPFPACPGSNYAEMFYMLAADPTGVVNGNVRTVEDVLTSTLGTVGHELQHLISASRRLYVVEGVGGTDWNEDVWLNEGLSHIAEELLFYHRAQLSPRMNLGSGILAQGSAPRASFILFGQQNYFRYLEYLRDPETSSPYADDDDLGTRGAIWAFLRYAADQRAGNDNQLWFNLVNSAQVGLTNLQAQLGTDPIPIFRDFAVSAYTDDAVAGVPAVFTQPSWNHRSLAQTISGGYPLRVRALTAGTGVDFTLIAGGAAHLRAAVAAGRRGSVRLSAGGAPLPETVQVTVVRTK